MKVFLKAKWENIIMANYQIEPKLLLPFLPKGVSLDLYQGKAYVSLVGFMFKNTKLFDVPIPFFGTFEEINLRFYVVRKEGDELKRGVVFINETIPCRLVAWIANKLYKEHYTVVPTKHQLIKTSESNHIQFEWLLQKKWNSIAVDFDSKTESMKTDSLEKFIYEHYYGYTKINEHQTEEYQLRHPSWKTHKINDYNIDCDFEAMYGKSFSILNQTKPTAVFIAKGSDVAIYWKRNKIYVC
jgi:uncharacterized protein YqjF (DUF2071 family)